VGSAAALISEKPATSSEAAAANGVLAADAARERYLQRKAAKAAEKKK
jgi:hypothetical protein